MKVYIVIVSEYLYEVALYISLNKEDAIAYYRANGYVGNDGDFCLKEFDLADGDSIVNNNDGMYCIRKPDGSIIDGTWIDVEEV